MKEYSFFVLFDKFISESKSGKRLKPDGFKIKTGTIDMYLVVRKSLWEFSDLDKFPLRICQVSRTNMREHKTEILYWKRFYGRYSQFLYAKGCFDNYVGAHYKVIRTFFNYLNRQKGISTGEVHKQLYIRTEKVPIIVLDNHQFHFLCYDEQFSASIPEYLKRTKDIFLFGCYTGLRYSDLMALTAKNVQLSEGNHYLVNKSIKTRTETRIKLTGFTLDVLKRSGTKKYLLPRISKARLNKNLKELFELAGWTHDIGKTREKRGAIQSINKNGKTYRFCDLVTTHTMRRTAITLLLTQGMPEIMVRKISGHAANSKEFYKYVHYSQQLIDKELDRIYISMPTK
ncbi:MAG: tyrosine-type recombinase/integrase [Chitinophagales bacterium]